MNMDKFYSDALAYLILIPGAASCYLPMKNQMKYPPHQTAAMCLAVLAAFIPAAAYVQARWGLENSLVGFPALAVFFLLYRRTIRADLPRALAVFVGVCAVESVSAQLSSALGAYLDPLAWQEIFSVEAALFQQAVALLMLAAAWTIRRKLVWVIDSLDVPGIWYSTVALSGIFLIFNVVAGPDSLEMRYAARPYRLFAAMELYALTLLVCVYALFYQGAKLLLERFRLERQSQLQEMQSHQYRALQEHMRQTARLRHDFRHSVRLLLGLAEQGDLEGIRAYLNQYGSGLLENATDVYCANPTLNALFGYYHEMAAAAGVELAWRIQLPEPLPVSELDLAGLFGNLIENALEGCQTLPPEKRQFSLTVETRQGSSLYIVSTNSFDGHVKGGGGRYRSTKHSGRGIGLASIAATAEKYGGTACFSNSDTEFFADVVIKI